tara:strand:+ start:281 stop:445 length:165 start_codon:yes stop_codon:yes gene_type:complete
MSFNVDQGADQVTDIKCYLADFNINKKALYLKITLIINIFISLKKDLKINYYLV